MTITPGNYDITIYQGTTFNQQFTWKDQNNALINLTGFSARMMARTSIDAAAPFITLTTANGGVVLGGAAGTITLQMNDTQTTALSSTSGVYDLEVIDGVGTVTRLLQGNLIVSAEVTR
jgi:hypothetical protein